MESDGIWLGEIETENISTLLHLNGELKTEMTQIWHRMSVIQWKLLRVDFFSKNLTLLRVDTLDFKKMLA